MYVWRGRLLLRGAAREFLSTYIPSLRMFRIRSLHVQHFKPIHFSLCRTLFDLNIKDVSQCVMPGVKKSTDVELQLHESDATDQTEVGHGKVQRCTTGWTFRIAQSKLVAITGYNLGCILLRLLYLAGQLQ